MNYMQIALGFTSGLGLFIFGMNYMGEGLQKAAGSKMKKLLEALTNNRLIGVLLGVVITAIMQSSSATTVMVVGFVNSGLMSLGQAVGVIMGANVGTTVTSWIVSLGEWSVLLTPTTLAPIAILIGVLMLFFSKKDRTNELGGVVFGFGVLFLGLGLMGDAVAPLSELPAFKQIFLKLGQNPILGILAGAAVTAIIQSSSASVGILQTLAAASLVPWSAAVYIILGQNIGTCVTAVLSGIGSTQNGKRAASIHLMFNIIGSGVFAVIAIFYFQIINPQLGQAVIGMTQISVVHTVFNILSTLVLFPFAGVLVYLAKRLIKDDSVEVGNDLVHLDSRILETPTFAIQSVTQEVVRMGEISAGNIKLAVDSLIKKDEEKADKVFEKENEINKLQHGINDYLIKLTNLPISEKEHMIVTGLFHTVSDIERIGDHAENIAELAVESVEDHLSFSEVGISDIREMYSISIKAFHTALDACANNDIDIAREVYTIEKNVNELEVKLRSRHLKRLSDKQCSSVSGVMFLDIISNLERVSDHATNVATTTITQNKTLVLLN